MTTTRCAVCNEPRADHGFTAVAGLDGKLGPWHEYLPPATAKALIESIARAADAYEALPDHVKRVVDSLPPRKD